MATPSMITRLPLELTLIESVPERADVKVVTEMSLRLTVLSEWRLTVLSHFEPQ